MSEFKADTDPAEVGLDPARLERLDRHFARYVDQGRLPGWLIAVSRNGRVAHVSACGLRDMEDSLPVESDTLWRIYSMSKPVTSVAAMMLYEEGGFELTDPISRYIPAFADMRVFAGGSDVKPVTAPATEPIRVWHLLSHTAGLTYGFLRVHPVDAIYRARGFEWSSPRDLDLAGCCEAWAGLPLLFEPGTEWNYSVATDVLGRLVEVVSGRSLDEFLAERVLAPLGMTDTAFWADADRAPRLGPLYTPGASPDQKAVRLDAMGKAAYKPPRFLAGGAGLVSSAADYHRFTQMLLGRPDSPAGELDGVRLLSPRTVAYMTRNHLPGGADLESFGRPLFAESPLRGSGFGLGFAVVTDPVAAKTLTSAGEFSWGGAASTAFYVDPAEQLTVSFFTQLLPSSTYPIRTQLRQLVQQALVD
ncbi:MAG TPA: serine hydrolase domain-containing protein [Streptosporangiaceae bacterium]|jgi:CubicO group peptidase (beta-lactamase class C family)|nr:serine hydrolase domain-containing protein [Streptosporangiaceae bacterium]